MAVKAWIATAAVAVVATLVLVACGRGNGGPQEAAGLCPSKAPAAAEVEGEVTVAELTDLVAEAITCPGYAFHMRAAGEYKTETYGIEVESDTWVDLENNVARTESVWRPSSGEALREAEEAGLEDAEARYTVIIHADANYSRTEYVGYPEEDDQNPVNKGRPPDCHAPGYEALGSLILCEGPLDDWETTVERDVSYAGQSAIALLSEGESGDADGTYETTNRLYFDAATLLPLGRVVETARGAPVDTDATYKHEFVPLDSLPEDFFDPASIGYVEPDPADVEKPLDDADVPVYWLGREFEGSDEYPALAIRHANVRPEAQTPEGSYIAEIVYIAADDEFGHYMVRIDLLTPAAWELREERTVHWPCEETVDLDVDGHEATLKIHHWGASQDRDGECLPPDRYSAVVHFDDVVVDIDAPATGTGRETFYSPYDSAEGIELLVRSLELRE